MSAKGSVLIVEDESAHGDAIAEGLRRLEFECTLVDSGASALAALSFGLLVRR